MSSYFPNTLRGGFGKALHDISCVQPGADCVDCSLGSRCAYGYLFRTPVPEDATMMRGYTHAPHPFVFRPPMNHSPMVQRDETINIDCVMVGDAVDYFPYIVFGLNRLGELGLGTDRVTFHIERAMGPEGETLYARDQDRPIRSPKLHAVTAELKTSDESSIRIHYRTPTRLRVNGRPLRRPDFGALVSAALRRLKLLCALHGAGTFDIDSERLATAAQSVECIADRTRWVDLERHSARQNQRVPIGGLIGAADFQGDVGPFLEILRLAANVHVGKKATAGHGFFEIEEGIRA